MKISSNTKEISWQVPTPPSETVLKVPTSWNFQENKEDRVSLTVRHDPNGFIIKHKNATYVLGLPVRATSTYQECLAAQKTAEGVNLFAVRQYHRDWSNDERVVDEARYDLGRLTDLKHTRAASFLLEDKHGRSAFQFLPAAQHTLADFLGAPAFQTSGARQALANELLPLVSTLQQMGNSRAPKVVGGSIEYNSHGNIHPSNIVFDGKTKPALDNFAITPYSFSKSRNFSYSPYVPAETFRNYWSLVEKAFDARHPREKTEAGYKFTHNDNAADLYAMGSILLHVLVGAHPFIASSVGIDLKDEFETLKFIGSMQLTVQNEYHRIVDWLSGGPFPKSTTRLIQTSKEGRWARPFFTSLSKADRTQRALHVAINLLHPNPSERGRLFEGNEFSSDTNSAFLVQFLAKQVPSALEDSLEPSRLIGSLLKRASGHSI